jgi:nucleotide-binding universal stress UspA family protein
MSIPSPIRTILLPTDGSNHSIDAATYILPLARYFEASVTLFYAIETPSRDYHGYIGDDLTAVHLVLDDEALIKTRATTAMMNTKHVFERAS